MEIEMEIEMEIKTGLLHVPMEWNETLLVDCEPSVTDCHWRTKY